MTTQPAAYAECIPFNLALQFHHHWAKQAPMYLWPAVRVSDLLDKF